MLFGCRSDHLKPELPSQKALDDWPFAASQWAQRNPQAPDSVTAALRPKQRVRSDDVNCRWKFLFQNGERLCLDRADIDHKAAGAQMRRDRSRYGSKAPKGQGKQDDILLGHLIQIAGFNPVSLAQRAEIAEWIVQLDSQETAKMRNAELSEGANANDADAGSSRVGFGWIGAI